MRKPLYRIFTQQHVCTVEVHLMQDGHWKVNLVKLKLKKGNPHLIESEEDILGEKVFELLDKKQPVCLLISGRGVLTKKVQFREQMIEQQVISSALPMAKADDLLYSIRESGSNLSAVYIVRKSIVDELLTKFQSHGIKVIDLYIGNECTSIDQTIAATNHLSDKIIPVYLASLNFLIIQQGKYHTSSQKIQSLWQDHYYGRIVSRIGIAVLTGCFAVLLINFLLFDHYNKLYARISAKGEHINTQIARHESLLNKIHIKQDLLTEMQLESASCLSYYADRIANTLTEGITLTRFSINPKAEVIRGRDLAFRNGQLIIRGYAEDGMLLNEWVKRLRQLRWIKQVEISEYNHDAGGGDAEFFLSLTINS